MPVYRRDNNELRYNAFFEVPLEHPRYFEFRFLRAKAFFICMRRLDLLVDFKEFIKITLEDKIGRDLHQILIIYKNLQYLNSFTRSHVPGVEMRNILKIDMIPWLLEIDEWAENKMYELEPDVMFSFHPTQNRTL